MKIVIQDVTPQELQAIILPSAKVHKGQNGRMLIIGGSALFHAASLWSLEVASRIVDLVHYASTPENNEIVQSIKKVFRNGIVIRRDDIPAYIEEDDCILIGPGMTRDGDTESLTNTLLSGYPLKQWIIDAGSLQMMDLDRIPEHAILTPHHREFELLWEKHKNYHDKAHETYECVDTSGVYLEEASKAYEFASIHACIVVLKGEVDIVASPVSVRRVYGGNAGMTKGGTGDVLSGLIAALACKNDPFMASLAGSFINKAAGDELYVTVGPFFNATDLTRQIPHVLKRFCVDR